MGYKYLFDCRFYMSCRFPEHLWTGRHRAQVHQLQSLAFYLLYHYAEDCLLFFFLFRKEYQPRSIFPFFWYGNAL